MMRIRIDMNSRAYERWLTAAARKQVPFATAHALTLTAMDAREEIKRELPNRFTIRNKRVQQGIRLRAATKRSQVAEVGSIDDFMVLQETGGTKRPKRSRRIAIPTKNVRRTKTGRIGKAKRPRQLLKKPNVFIRGGAIMQRTRSGLKALFILTPSARIEPRFGLRRTAEQVANRRLNRNFIRAMTRAMRTSRPI